MNKIDVISVANVDGVIYLLREFPITRTIEVRWAGYDLIDKSKAVVYGWQIQGTVRIFKDVAFDTVEEAIDDMTEEILSKYED